jgi:hypothetical protein
LTLIDRVRPFGRKPVAFALGAFLAIGALMAPSLALAAGDSFAFDPGTISTTTGGTFTVKIAGTSGGAISGASAAVTFDSSKIKVTDIAKGADWVDAGAVWVGFPSDKAAAIAAWNTAGKIAGYPTGSIAATFVDGSTSVPAGKHVLLTVTFKVAECGDSTLEIPVGPNDAGMVSGESGKYPCAGASPSPTPTPSASASVSPTPTPTATPATSPTATPVATATPKPTTTIAPTTPPVPTDQPTDSAAPTDDTGGAGGTDITPPPTGTVPAQAGSPSGSWQLVVLGIGLGLVATVILLVARSQMVRRRN